MGFNLASWAVHPLALLLIVGVALLASQTAVVVGHPTALVTGTGSLGTKSSRTRTLSTRAVTRPSRYVSRIISRVKNRSNKPVASRVIARFSTSWIIARVSTSWIIARISTSWIISGITSTRIVPRAPTIPSRVVARIYSSRIIAGISTIPSRIIARLYISSLIVARTYILGWKDISALPWELCLRIWIRFSVWRGFCFWL